MENSHYEYQQIRSEKKILMTTNQFATLLMVYLKVLIKTEVYDNVGLNRMLQA